MGESDSEIWENAWEEWYLDEYGTFDGMPTLNNANQKDYDNFLN